MKIGIIGTGLIGGSLGLALKRTEKYKVFCWNRRVEISRHAVRMHAADKYFDTIEKLSENSDIIIIATPLNTYAEVCKKISRHLDGKKIISDVGSVKLVPVNKALKNIPVKYKSFFVPAHPIAGKERGGIGNATADLFKGKRVIICKTANCKKGKKLATIWKDIGSKVELMSAQKHDEIYAYVSHYVQFLSFICSEYLPDTLGEFSRLMDSPYEMWGDIFELNSKNLKKVHEEFKKSFLRKLKNISTYKGKNEYEVVAKIIADSYTDIVPVEYKKYAGSGYKSFTSILHSASKNASKTEAKKVSKLLTAIYNELKKTKL